MKKLPLRSGYLALCLCVLPSNVVDAAAKIARKAAPKSARPSTPKAGSLERKAIIDALRKPVQKETKFPIIFKVGHLKTQNGWAFLSGSALHANGKPIETEFLWGEVAALFRKKGKTWTVLHWGFATDTGVMDKARQKWKQAPRAIFPS